MDLKRIQRLVKLVEDASISHLSVEHEGMKIEVKKELSPTNSALSQLISSAPSVLPAAVEASVANSQAVTDAKTNDSESNLKPICAQMVGTFYQSSSPDSDPFVSVGKTISKGDVLCIIEAMKLFNEFESEWSGTIKKICVNNGDSVEFGQTLFLIEES